jgi:glycerol-3-phosphate acyltransferase PlsY
MSSWSLILGAYLLGAVPFSYLIVRWRSGKDVRDLGSGNAGATNVLRTTGVAEGVLTLILDMLKGAAAVGTAQAYDAAPEVVAGCGVAAVVGHIYPVYLGFRGGKGVATASGALGSLSPVPTLAALAVFVIVVVPTRYVALASVLATVSYPLALLGASHLGWIVAAPWTLEASIAIAVLVVFKHRENLRRLRTGTEPRLERGTLDEET